MGQGPMLGMVMHTDRKSDIKFIVRELSTREVRLDIQFNEHDNIVFISNLRK